MDKGKQKTQRQYLSPCMAWKWYCFCFNAAFLYEIIVVAFYWIVLFPTINKNKSFHLLALEYADHFFPLLCLLIDYILLGSIPISLRLFPFVILMVVFYLVFNLIYTLNFGPIYPPITWKGIAGIGIPLGLILVGILLGFLLEYITRIKLKA